MNQDAIKHPVGQWAEKRLAKLTGKSNGRHNSENNSGFGRDLRKWIGKDLVLPGNTISVALVGKNMGHPAAFPVGLPEFFIKLFSKEGDTILDPFAGSGSTGLAAENLNRNVVLIDNKKEYFEAMKRRLNQIKSNRERFFIVAEYNAPVETYSVPTLIEARKNFVGKKSKLKLSSKPISKSK